MVPLCSLCMFFLSACHLLPFQISWHGEYASPCQICLFCSTTRPNKAQRMMGMHLLIVAVVPTSSASALLQLKNFWPRRSFVWNCNCPQWHQDTFLIVVPQNWQYRVCVEAKSDIVSCRKPTGEISNNDTVTVTDKLKVGIQPPVVVNWEILWSLNQSSSGICILGQGQ